MPGNGKMLDQTICWQSVHGLKESLNNLIQILVCLKSGMVLLRKLRTICHKYLWVDPAENAISFLVWFYLEKSVVRYHPANRSLTLIEIASCVCIVSAHECSSVHNQTRLVGLI